MAAGRRIAALLAASLMLAVPARAAAQPIPLPTIVPVATASELLARLADDPTLPASYTANVALTVRMRVFPFIRVKLHGDSTFKRPGLYRFVFRDVPLIARAFSDLRYDLGDPAQWPQRYDVALAPSSTPEAPVLRLIPHTAQQVRWLEVSVDPQKGHLAKAVWTRKDGGIITLVQTFTNVNDRELVKQQTATIDLPHMKADLSAEYRDFTVGTVPADR